MINSDPAREMVDYLNRLKITLSTERKMHFFPQRNDPDNPVLVLFVEQDGEDSYFEISLIIPRHLESFLNGLTVQLYGPCQREITWGFNHPVVFLKLPKGDYKITFALPQGGRKMRTSVEIKKEDLFRVLINQFVLSGDVYRLTSRRFRLHLFVNFPGASKITLIEDSGRVVKRQPLWFNQAVFASIEEGNYIIEVE